MKSTVLNKKQLLLVAFLALILFFLNNFIFGKQLDYGFRDVDWMSLYYYKLFGNFSLNHFLQILKANGAYTHQVYYVGFLEQIFGLNFKLLHLSSQIFKVLAAITLYFLVLKVSENKLLAFLTSVLYTISYTHAGVLFQLSTGSYFPGVILMNLFLIVYWVIISGKKGLRWLILAGILLLSTLFVTTERMYPLVLLIVLVELVSILFNKFNKEVLGSSIKRLFFVLLPLIVLIFVYDGWFKNIINNGFAPNQFFLQAGLMSDSILKGNWQFFLYPFASLGSIFLYGDFWKYLGQVDVSNFTSYLLFLIFGPVLKLGILSIVLMYFIAKNAKKVFKLTVAILLSLFGFGLISYIVNRNWNNLDTQIRIHFDPNLVLLPAIFGFFIITFSIVIFFEWVKSKNNQLLPLIIGPAFSFFFILTTWIASDLQLVSLGPHRYLSIPSIGVVLFISGFIVLIFDRLKSLKYTKQIARMIFLALIPLIFINYQVASDFFNYELSYAGMGANDQTRIKNEFWAYVPNMSNTERSLFYFDETADKDNGYFDESTIMAGLDSWVLFDHGKNVVKERPVPGILRTNIECPQISHNSCIEMMRSELTKVNGEEGLLYADRIRYPNNPRFYNLKNFYAFRFIKKHLVDIKKEVLEELHAE